MIWSKPEIRRARKIPLASLLLQQGFQLRELPGENLQVQAFGDLFVRDCYWIWKSHRLQGNTIDFFIMVQNKSFSETMQILIPKAGKDPNPTQNLPNPQNNIPNLPS